jgi:hypothetical protein
MTIGAAQVSNDAVLLIGETHQFGSPFDRDAQRLQPLDQQLLVLVLGKDL